MADFIAKAKKRPVETITVLGERIEVRGLSIGELMDLTKSSKGEPAPDNQKLAAALISLCCYGKDGNKIIPDPSVLDEFSPDVFRQLNEAVTRVNGGTRGNPKATVDEDFSSD